MFHKITQLVARDTLLIYPNFNERLDIHTYASDFQLGAVISYNRNPIALYSRKITPEQSR